MIVFQALANWKADPERAGGKTYSILPGKAPGGAGGCGQGEKDVWANVVG